MRISFSISMKAEMWLILVRLTRVNIGLTLLFLSEDGLEKDWPANAFLPALGFERKRNPAILV